VAHASPDRSSDVVYVGQIGTRETDIDKSGFSRGGS
jgi:hypothetical protein